VIACVCNHINSLLANSPNLSLIKYTVFWKIECILIPGLAECKDKDRSRKPRGVGRAAVESSEIIKLLYV
jgi:hypothetical protein